MFRISRSKIISCLSACMLAGLLLFAVSGPAMAQAPAAHAAAPQGHTSTDEGSTPINAVPEKREEVHDENYEYTHSDAVKAFGRMMGMSTETAATVFTVFNFLLLVIGVGFVVLKTVPKAFRNRSTAIQKKLVDARTATEEAKARLDSVEARLSKLDEQIAGMHKQAEIDSAHEEQRIKATVEEQKVKILADADAEIHAATSAARREIQKYAAELAIEQAVRKLVVTAETDRLLVEDFAHKLGLSADKGGAN
jgi:F-type H+-transporting ATPase subunit b